MDVRSASVIAAAADVWEPLEAAAELRTRGWGTGAVAATAAVCCAAVCCRLRMD